MSRRARPLLIVPIARSEIDAEMLAIVDGRTGGCEAWFGRGTVTGCIYAFALEGRPKPTRTFLRKAEAIELAYLPGLGGLQ
jgi:hypothetical protein